MFDEFIKELRKALIQNNVENIDIILADYEEKYNKLIDSGKSEFESVIALGDIEEILCSVTGKEYTAEDRLNNNIPKDCDNIIDKKDMPKSVTGVYLTDAFYYTPAVLISAFGILATAFISVLAAIIGIKYAIFSWIEFDKVSTQVIGFFLSLLTVACACGGAYLSVLLSKNIIVGSKKYFKDRKLKLSYLKESK